MPSWTRPKKGKAREAKINDLLFTLRALKWSELVSPKGEDAPRYGLDKPVFEVTLWKEDGSELGLIVGRKDADKTYLKTKASPALYAVESRQLGDLPKSPTTSCRKRSVRFRRQKGLRRSIHVRFVA